MWVFGRLLNRRWRWITLIVILGMLFQFRLALWQWSRYEERTAYNEQIFQKWDNDPVDLNSATIPDDLVEWEFRRIEADGVFDFENQIVLKGQNYQTQAGVQLITPFMLDDQTAILVARGWIPFAESKPEQWSQFDEPEIRKIRGLAQESQVLPADQQPEEADGPQTAWFRIDISKIEKQLPYKLLPFFIYQLPEEGRSFSTLPIREDRHPALYLRSPWLHINYVIQWASFSLILGFTYIMLVRKEERKAMRQAAEEKTDGVTATTIAESVS